MATIIASGAALVLLGVGAVRFLPLFHCHDEMVTQEWSPDRRHLVSIVSRDCGATTTVAIHIVVSTRALRLPIGQEQAVCVVNDSTGVRVRWDGPNRVVIHRGVGKSFRSRPSVDGVQVVYAGE